MLFYLTETSSNQQLEKCIVYSTISPKINYVYVEVGSHICHLCRPHQVLFGNSSCHEHLQAI